MRHVAFFTIFFLSACSSGPGDVGVAPGDDTGSVGTDSTTQDSFADSSPTDSGIDGTPKDSSTTDTSVADTRTDAPTFDATSSDAISTDAIASDGTTADVAPPPDTSPPPDTASDLGTTDAPALCGDFEPTGKCTDGSLSCQCCPGAGPTEHCLCTTICASDTDCKDSSRPKCQKAPGALKGFCAPTTLTCCWLCG